MRKHIKNFQVEQYNMSDERIKKAAFYALMCLTFGSPIRQFKRYQII